MEELEAKVPEVTKPPRGERLEPMSPEVAIAGSLLPWPYDDAKARYLGFRACGLSPREATHMVHFGHSWLSKCRRDPKFLDIENRIPEIRRELAKEYTEIDFYRNFRLVMEKDYRVLQKSLGMAKDDAGNTLGMTPYDQQYLLKMRANYSPQQLSIIEAVVSGASGGFNFAQFMADHPDLVQAQLSRTETLTVSK